MEGVYVYDEFVEKKSRKQGKHVSALNNERVT